MNIQTKTIHAGHSATGTNQPVVPSIQMGTIWTHPEDGFDSRSGSFGYARYGNPNRTEFETLLAAIEHGEIAAAFSSGMTAITMAFQALEPGDHVVICDDVYHGTRAVLNDIMQRWGLKYTYVDVTNPQHVADALTPKTRMVWLETPSNPRMLICDIEDIVRMVREYSGELHAVGTDVPPDVDKGVVTDSDKWSTSDTVKSVASDTNTGAASGADTATTSKDSAPNAPSTNPAEIAPSRILVCVDNTWGTPVLQNPLLMGADVVMHSCTKYIGGHSDVLAGALVFRKNDAYADRIRTMQKQVGAVLAPFDSWLLVRSLKTLYARVRIHCENARLIAEYLSKHPKIEDVYYPGLPDSPGHHIAKKQMKDFGGMVSALFPGETKKIMQGIRSARLFKVATSLGGVESLWEHRASSEGPTSRTHPQLVRMSVGIEHPDDLIADIDQVLRQL